MGTQIVAALRSLMFVFGCLACADSGGPGVPFDPLSVRAGEKVGDLTVSEIATRKASDGTVLGSARFTGELRLTGATFRHPEFPDVLSVCFEADSASANRLPRWSGDTRRAWFCLDNSGAAAKSLALPGEIRPADIAITDFVIHRGASDEVNSAKLTRVMGRGAVTSSPYTQRKGIPFSSDDAENAAKAVVSFLRGESEFDPQLFADTVTLFVSPEGGSGSTRLSRDNLRRRSNWTVASTRRNSFVPPTSMRYMTTRYGAHFNCHEYPLATRYPVLAKLPHVGVKLEADKTGSCLQTWNATMVFSDSTKRPLLVAAVYDQWEW